jgi:hypothetical protein
VRPFAFLLLVPAVLAQRESTTGHPSQITVPFVGCAEKGQLDDFKAPTGTPHAAAISRQNAQKLAYYKAAIGPGVLAPRGWYCLASYGSAGDALRLSPDPIKSHLPGSSRVAGPAIEIYHDSSAAYGMYSVAEILARVFPEYKDQAATVLALIKEPVPSGPYPEDALTYRSKSVVEFIAPPQSEGLGTYLTRLRKSSLPVSGAVIMLNKSVGSEELPDILFLAIRLPPALQHLPPWIIRDAERDAVVQAQ